MKPKAVLKRVLPWQWQAAIRRGGRLRWLTKLDVLRYSGISWRNLERHHLAYLLWDPEVESHTYEVENVDEMVEVLATALGASPEIVAGHIEEAATDPVLTTEWSRRMAWRFDAKRHLLLGNRLLWWGLIRTLRPSVVVECGSYHGVGSLVILRALQRNAEEGDEGRLISIDVDPSSGWVVPEGVRSRWTRVQGLTTEVLGPVVRDLQVDLLFHDTPHTVENARHEFTTALAAAADPLVLADGSGGVTGVLEELCTTRGGSFHRFVDRPLRHLGVGDGVALGWFGTRPEPEDDAEEIDRLASVSEAKK